MKIIHLSDLHLGKRVHEFSMLDDQRYILKQILEHVAEEHPDAVILAGDIYDKPVPPAEAVQLFDQFLCGLAEQGVEVMIISGNHDSAERIAFGGKLMEHSGVHVSPVYDGDVKPVELEDEYGIVQFFLLPFIKPIHVRRCYAEDEIESYTDAMHTAISHMERNADARQVLVTHQFVTGAERSDSEEISVGGTDNVDVTVFDGFDYVALGHIHGPQDMVDGRIRYCGSPLKYSFSEAGHHKSVTVAEIGSAGNVDIHEIPLTPLRDMTELKGTYDELTAKSFYKDTGWKNNYIHITLTDEEDVPEAVARLRVIYPYLMKLDYDNRRTRSGVTITDTSCSEKRSPLDIFADFYEMQNDMPMSDEQSDFVTRLIEDIWEGQE